VAPVESCFFLKIFFFTGRRKGRPDREEGWPDIDVMTFRLTKMLDPYV
jgi:hypothetical protein